MALGFDKMTEMARRRRRSRRTGRDQTRRDDPARRVLRAVGAAPHARPRHHARALRRPSPPRTGTTAPLCPMAHRQPDHTVTVEEVLASRMVARAAHRDDGVPGRRRRRLRDRRPRGPGCARRQPGRTARAAGRVGAAERDATRRAHVPRPGRRPGDDDARHRASCLRGRRRSGPTTSTSRSATTPSPTRSSSTTSCSASAPRARARSSSRRARPALGGRIPFNTDGGLHRPRPPRRADRAGAWSTRSCSSCAARPAAARSRARARALAHLVGGGSVCTVNLFEGSD